MNYIHRDITFPSSDGKNTIHAELFIPSDNNIKAVVQISHGMMDYIGRYRLMAEAFCSEGIALAGNDHLVLFRCFTIDRIRKSVAILIKIVPLRLSAKGIGDFLIGGQQETKVLLVARFL